MWNAARETQNLADQIRSLNQTAQEILKTDQSILAVEQENLVVQKQILAILQGEGTAVGVTYKIGTPVHNIGGGKMPATPFPLGDDQNVNVTFNNPLTFVDDAGQPAAAPVDSAGNPAVPSISFGTDQPTILSVTPDSTGFVPNVKALGPQGLANLVATISFAPNASSPAGTTAPTSITQNIPFQVQGTAAVAAGYSIGTPVHN